MLRINDEIALAGLGADRELPPRLRARRAERQQGLDRGGAALRGGALAEPRRRRRRRGCGGSPGWRWTGEGALIVTAERHRSQALNRAEAREKLRALVLAALERPKPRRPTRPTAGSVRRRLEAKARRGGAEGRARLAVGGGVTGARSARRQPLPERSAAGAARRPLPPH